MPSPNGLEVCRLLKQDGVTASITIVMLTALAQETDRERAFVAGADDYLTKPFSPTGLMQKVDEILGTEWQSSNDKRASDIQEPCDDLRQP